MPTGLVTQNELDAAKTVHFDYLNAQEQRKFVWPPSYAKARAFLDQLERDNGLEPAQISAARAELASAEKLSGRGRQQALRTLATQLTGDAKAARDQAKVRMLSTAVTELVSMR